MYTKFYCFPVKLLPFFKYEQYIKLKSYTYQYFHAKNISSRLDNLA